MCAGVIGIACEQPFVGDNCLFVAPEQIMRLSQSKEIGGWVMWVELESFLDQTNGFLRFSCTAQDFSQSNTSVGVVGIKCDGLPRFSESLIKLSCEKMDVRQRLMRSMACRSFSS